MDQQEAIMTSKGSIDYFGNYRNGKTEAAAVITVVEWNPHHHHHPFHNTLRLMGVQLMWYVCKLSLDFRKLLETFLQVMIQMCSLKI